MTSPLVQRKNLPAFILLIAIIVGLGFIGIYTWYLLHNYAQDAAQPLENVLTQNGAVKVCSSGDAGRGPDNARPMYQADFQLNVGKDQATTLVKKAASDNGFTLSPTSSPYSYLDRYSDTSSKKSTYPGFDHGNVELTVSVNSGNGGKPLSCTSDSGKTWTTLKVDDTHTAVTIGVSLPYANK